MISRLKRMSRGGWITFGIVLGAIIAPGIALAAFSDIRIVGVNGSPIAQVTPVNQLRTAPTDPSRLKRYANYNLTQFTGCQNFPVPSGNALILHRALVNVYDNPTPGAGNAVIIYSAANCPGNAIASVNPGELGVTEIPFEPGIAIKAGTSFSARAIGEVEAELYAFGYMTPPAAVPATTARLGRKAGGAQATQNTP